MEYVAMAKGKDIPAWLNNIVECVRNGQDSAGTADSVSFIAEYAKVGCILWMMMPGGEVDGVKVARTVLKQAPRSPGKVMLTVSGTRGKKSVVTFHTGDAGIDIFRTFWARAEAGSLSWREDTPYQDHEPPVDIGPLPTLGGC